MLELPNELLGSRVPGGTGSEPRWRRIFKLEDLPWLGAHHIQNQTVIPTALFCVMALAAAMDISNGKQADSIELSDITIGRPIVLEASSVEIETSLSISSLVDSGIDGIDTVQADFSLNKSAPQDPNTVTVAKGRLRMTFADHELGLFSSSRPSKPCGLRPVNINQFYDSLRDIGLSYGGPFRALTSAERRMDYACGVVAPTTGGASSISALLHPAILEACFQTLLLAFAAPRDGSLWTAFAPTKIGRLTLFPNSCFGLDTPASVTVDAHLQEYTSGYESEIPIIYGDVNVYSSDTAQLQFRLENVTISPITRSTERQDRQLYLKKIWRPDILSGPGLKQENHISSYERLGLSQAHKYILAASRLISHRYAKLKILQVGTSCINLVQALCHAMGNSMGSYTIADASDRAIDDMRRGLMSDDPAIEFIVVDILRDVGRLDETTALGPIDLSSFDLIIHLKATSKEFATMKSIRGLLKSGGFLLMTMTVKEAMPLEATEFVRKEIHDTLQSVGFSGVSSLAKDQEPDSPFVILSQAVDDQVNFLTSPLNSKPPFTTSGTLLVIGGVTQEIKQFIEAIQSRLGCVWDGEIMLIRSLTDLKSRDLDQVEAVLSLTELDQSVLESLSRDTFQGLHQLLNGSKTVLWVTYSAENLNPHQSGTIGLVRAVQAENPDKVLQVLNLDQIDGSQTLVAESFLRLIGAVRMRDDSSNRLWTVEPELSVQRGKLLIPRVLFDKKRNDRLNCSRRRVEASDPFEKQSGTLVRPIDPSGLFSPDKTYVLIGLSGQIGQSITRWIVGSGGRHIVITSRNPDKDGLWIKELEKQGANVVIKAADVTKNQDMINLRNHILSTMPPIGGVANGAMLQSNCFFSDLTYDDLQEVLRPKVDGSLVLNEVFSRDDLDFFLLLSSISAVVGQPFQANYDAANNFMTGLVSQRRARNLPASVINLGPIIGLGFIQNIDSSGGSEAVISTLRGLDYMLVSDRELHHILAEAILIGKSDETPEIITGLETVSDNPPPFWHKSLLFSHII
ncbi:putative PKS-like enzyme [Aspergillus udagawae]|uniref:PKS/NRPS-like protein biosynthetic cluster n=1 Tax=Aspergillus udagawae TaxID=91492 RepID=A0A8E0QVJ9_9EURO|nr:putative PKS/NRPS-like protein biosynthetic cluster [Aspergillus udagawae]GIC92267.1 putative PKS/NRPS-like protein biosynthetic cluster [Aspergillus udagawae]